MERNFYVTTPIYYVNDKPHVGHFYSTLSSDVLARFMRLDGYRVKFCTGTDEHGQKIERAARDRGMDVKDLVAQNCGAFKQMNADMHCTNDLFVRTTDHKHKRAVEAIWRTLEANGCIYLGKYTGWYAARDESFYTEADLIDGLAPTGAPVEWIEEESYFFNLSQWQDKLLALYEDEPDFIFPPSRRNEVVKFVQSGLMDLSISRKNVSWGIPVPSNPTHTIYVWIDALTNYISALGYPDTECADYHEFWLRQEFSPTHIVGKDILKFHAIYWPAMLMAANITLPRRIVAHGWWQSDGRKISKSLGNAVDYLDLIRDYGLDKVRYFFMREIGFGGDGNFTLDTFISRTNADLSNNVGNFVQRTLCMARDYCGSKVPQPKLEHHDIDLLNGYYGALISIRGDIMTNRFDSALYGVQLLATRGNQFVDTSAPWSLKRSDSVRMETVIYMVLEMIRCIGIYMLPFVPDAAKLMLQYIGVDPTKNNILTTLNAQCALTPGSPLDQFAPLFPAVR